MSSLVTPCAIYKCSKKEHTYIYINEKDKFDDHKITRAEYNIKRKKIEEKIRTMNARMRVLQGGLTREKRHQEEQAEEKKKKKEEKLKKKEKKRKEKEE